jgi:arsenite methyltransferase
MNDLAKKPAARANYGLDAPGLVKLFFLLGCALCLAGIALVYWRATRLLISIGSTAFITGLIFLFESLAMTWSSRIGKLKARDRLLGDLRLSGHETILDIGCGRGLLLIGAAHRLPTGKAVGIDLWSKTDLADNRREATLENARLEGVAQRVEVQDGDMRQLPFPDASFDAVVASLSIHNIYDRPGRRDAINEIIRVLKPAGKVALMDIRHTAQYAEDLRAAGMTNVNRSGLIFWIFPPVRTVTATK